MRLKILLGKMKKLWGIFPYVPPLTPPLVKIVAQQRYAHLTTVGDADQNDGRPGLFVDNGLRPLLLQYCHNIVGG
jgi:hypothetical protein